MQLTITIPATVSIETINAALAGLGATVKAKVARMSVKPDADYEPVIVRDKDGNEVREIDGVSVQKAIRKIMAEVNRGHNSDGRSNGAYPDYSRVNPTDGDDIRAEQYAKAFCSALHHVPALYSNGVTA